MRTTIDVEDGLLQQARRRAAEAQTTLSRLVSDALKAYLSRRRDRPRDVPFELITFGDVSGPPPPGPQGIDRLTLTDELASRKQR